MQRKLFIVEAGRRSFSFEQVMKRAKKPTFSCKFPPVDPVEILVD
jgi:hypothetical protein